MQDAGGGRVLRGVAGRGSSYIWTGEKILYTWARLLICCPSPLPFSPLLLVVLVVSCGLDAVADSRRDGMRAGGCCLLVADGRRGGVLVGKRGGRWPGVSPSAFALCPCPSACWAWCWRWRAGRLASSAGQGWRGRRVGAGACRCWAGCPGHQAGCYPSYCTKFRLKIQHNAENDASCFDTFTA